MFVHHVLLIVESLIKLEKGLSVYLSVSLHHMGNLAAAYRQLCSQKLYQSLDSMCLPHWYFSPPFPQHLLHGSGALIPSLFLFSHIEHKTGSSTIYPLVRKIRRPENVKPACGI